MSSSFFIRLHRLVLASTLLLGTLVASSGPARAEAGRRVVQRRMAQTDSGSRAALIAERQRVRGELEKANADIDALKRSGRGLREDYRLRERLADAEALARRLTDLDARLGAGAAPKASEPGAEPRVSPGDGPAELDAKADILADQAQRLAARGDSLLGRARDLRARQTLRRRVGQMERDPFSPLEGSKRRAVTGTLAVGGLGAGATGNGNGSPTPVGGAGDTTRPVPAVPAAGQGTGVLTGGSMQTPPPRTDVPGASPQPAGAGTGTPVVGTSGSAVSSPTSAPAPTSATDATALSVQLRDLLDATTLAEIQHLEATGGATSFDALEHAGAALKARAERLRQQAAALRAGEHPAPRAR